MLKNKMEFKYSIKNAVLLTLVSYLIIHLTVYLLDLLISINYLSLFYFPVNIPVLLGAFIFSIIIAKILYNKKLFSFISPWYNKNTFKTSLKLCLFFLIIILLLLSIILIIVRFCAQSNINFKQPNIWTNLNTYLFLIYFFLFVGLFEETLFRGIIQSALMKYYNKVFIICKIKINFATWITAILFTLWHVEFSYDIFSCIIPSLIVLPISLVICYIFEKTNSLLTVIIFHNLIDFGKFLIQCIIFNI